MKTHQVKCFRCLRRLPDNNTPARTALKCLNWEAKKASRPTKENLEKNLEKNLKDCNLNWDSAMEMAKELPVIQWWQ